MLDTMLNHMVVIKMSDMNKKLCWYRLIFKQLTPLHIGMKNYGVLSETRLFIPEWTIWGALVAAYGKIKGWKDADFKNGQELLKSSTCFFPVADKEKCVMFPTFKNGKIYIGDFKEEEFRLNYTDTYVSTTYVSTSIRPEDVSAKDNSLHETEAVLTKSKKDGKQIYWVGLIGIREDDKSNFINFMNQLEEIFVGGDIRYGFGNLNVLKDKISEVNEEALQDWNIDLSGNVLCNGKPIKKYLKCDSNYILQKGKLEFILKYDFSKSTPTIIDNGFFFVPGSEVRSASTLNE